MSTFWILLEQMELFVIYILAGVILVKSRLFNRETLQPISKFVLRMGLPLLIFTNIINGVERNVLLSSGSVLMLAFLFYVAMFFISMGIARIFHVKGKTAQIYQTMSMFGNIGFMGIPIITSIYPENGMLYICVFTIIDQLMLWTAGVRLTSGTNSQKNRFDFRKLINPVTVSIFLAVICVLTGIRLPEVLNNSLQKIGQTATPLAMIYLGGVFACIDVLKNIRRLDYYGIVILKMLLFPLFFYVLLGYLPVSSEIRTTMALTSAMPVMSSVVMMANAYGSDGDYAMGGILVTTICSVFTLPFIYWIFHFIG